MLSASIVFPLASTVSSAKTVLASGPGVTDYPWTMFHNDPARTGATLAYAPTTPNLQWTFNTGSIVYASPVVVDGIVFISSYDGYLYAIDEYTGTLQWSFRTSAPIYASPAVANGKVFVASKDSFVYALDEKTGSLVWSKPNISPITSSPVAAGGMVFYGTWFVRAYSILWGVNATTGIGVWQYQSDETVRSPPSVLSGRVFFTQVNGAVIALNETTGSLLWRVTAGANPISAAPALGYGRVFVGMDSSQFVALDQVTGTPRWSFPIGSVNATTGAVANGMVYFGTGNGIVYALNATSGTVKWQFPLSGSIGPVSSSPAISVGSKSILFGSSDHYLYSLNMTTGALLWKYLSGSTISSSPAIADNRTFFGAWDTKIYSLGSNARLQTTLTANPTSVKSGTVSVLSVTVTNGTTAQSGVTFAFSSSPTGSFTAPTVTGPGSYSCNFTAPTVTSSTTATIQVMATKPGYAAGFAVTTIAVQPLPSLTVSVSIQPASVSPGTDAGVKIVITNGTRGVPGATVVLSHTEGGTLSGVTDGGDGNYTAVFSTPLQTSNPVITANANKTGYTSGQGSATVSVAGLPNPVSLKLFGIPFLVFLAIGLAITFLLFIVAFRKKGSGTKDVPKPVPAPPVYAIRLRGFPGRLI